ncbi:RsmB/NOP family class I SAM-dependent RNA methyltransferase [Agrococcus carbonis]|uniref:16S rRNA (Cytosine967-C5)-methyltransferase n=1 Tax=Agrococcus carbonis TaxID=684552 RepID=A0A1H1KX10_9MICO|nr:transcription antitermination factor NusB [Agrococcus carbonis]SDR66871.1 16S rRNA (cytosine967-C5)-methyltransferase [Agrococcus carbonis]
MTANPRQLARDVVLDVARDDAYANLLLPKRIREAHLSAADAGFATELAYGTLRWQGQHDALIADAAGRPITEIDPETLATLRIGSHQLAHMRVPSHAAVHETVALLGRHKGRAGFANAVLRRLSEVPADERLARIAADLPADERLALETGHPTWVLRALRRTLEREGAADELPELLAADNDPPAVQLVALPGLARPDELALEATASPIGRIAPAGDPARLPQVAGGSWRVQDAGSQLAALALTRARPVAAGERWLDVCAGPGGKAALMAAEAAIGGAQLEANEVAPHRAKLVRQAVRAVGERFPDARARVVTGDGRRYGEGDTEAAFDRILLDAPCTGLGALRRRPEARWRKEPSDVPALATLQAELLAASARALKPGGLLAYVTCSPHLAETRAIVDRAAALGLEPVDTGAVVAELSPGIALGETGAAVQLWPHRNGTDAMFIQLLTTADR